MGFLKKAWLTLLTTALLATFLPASAASAVASATVEVNDGVAIGLDPEASTLDVLISVKNLPDLGADNGLAGVNFLVSWDPAVIDVTDVISTYSSYQAHWNIQIGDIDHVNGTVSVAGTNTYYYINDVDLLEIDLVAVGDFGDTTTLDVTVNEMIDKDSVAIPVAQVIGSAVTVNTPPLESITVAPETPSIAAGLTQQFTATANYQGGATRDVTGSVAWTSSNPLIASIETMGDDSPGLATGLQEGGPVTITATSGETFGTAELTVTAPILTDIIIVPTTSTIAGSQIQQFTAIGTFTNGYADVTDTATWTSTNPGVATIQSTGDANPGLATPVGNGSTSITAAQGGFTSPASTLNVVASAVINDGLPLILTEATPVLDVHLSVKDLPDLGADNGLAGVNFLISWDPAVIDVTDVMSTYSSYQAHWNIQIGDIDHVNGNVSVAGTNTYYYITDVDLLEIDITPVGSAGAATTLDVTINEVIDKDSVAITPVTDVDVDAQIAIADLASIDVTPDAHTVAKGTPVQYTATGNLGGGGTVDLTDSVTWTSTNLEAATITSVNSATPGTASTVGEGPTGIVASFGGVTGFTSLVVTPAELVSVSVTPTSSSIALGLTEQFTAEAIYTDRTEDVSSTAVWNSSSNGVATISSTGLATSVATGSTNIKATWDGMDSNIVPLTVTPKELVSIAVTPENPVILFGQDQQFAATGTYTDESTAILTDTVAWASTEIGVATIQTTGEANPGLAASVNVGTSTITASLDGVAGDTLLTVNPSELLSIDVTPVDPSVALGVDPAFTATGNYAGDVTMDITTTVTWTSDDPSVATIETNTGQAETLKIGSTMITAAYDGKSGTSTLTVTAAEPIGLTITPDAPTIYTGNAQNQQQFAAMVTYTDGTELDQTNAATWDSSVPGIATIGLNTGLATAGDFGTAGQTVISADYMGLVNDTTTLETIEPTLTGITVTPADPIVKLGYTQAFTATGNYNSGATKDLTADANWASSEETIATIQTTGGATPGLALASATNEGITTISAEFGGITGDTTMETQAAILQTIVVEPLADSVAAGRTLQLTATGYYDVDPGTGVPITDNVNWSSEDATKVSVQTTGEANPGQVQGETLGIGSTMTITAELDGKSASAEITVTPAVLEQIDITPLAPSIPKGRTIQFTATGTYSDGTTPGITNLVNWSSDDNLKATIDGTGLATGTGEGFVNITASLSGVDSDVALEITAHVIDSIAVTPATASIAKGLTQQYTATATYSDAETDEITATANWASSDAGVADFISTAGVATGLAVGTTEITAELDGITSDPVATLTITKAELTDLAITPTNSTINYDAEETYTITATFTDNPHNVAVDWKSSNTGVATVVAGAQNQGVAHGYSAGTTTITATIADEDGMKQSVTAQLTVNAPGVKTRELTPANPQRINGDPPVQFRYIITYDDNSKEDVTNNAGTIWASSREDVATVTAGRATIVGPGTTTISGTYDGNEVTTDLVVGNAVLTGITVNAPAAVAAGGTAQFQAMGALSAGGPIDITDRVTWSSSDSSVAVMRTGGLATTYADGGPITITATLGEISGDAQYTVDAAVLTGVVVTPADPTITRIAGATQTKQFKATAKYSDGSILDVTTDGGTAWSSTTAAATVSATGLVTIVNAGTPDIQAVYDGQTGTTTLNINADTNAPTVKMVSPSYGTSITDDPLTVSGTVSDANANIKVYLDGAEVVDLGTPGTTFTTTINLATPTKHQVEVRATDPAGNVGSSGSQLVELNPDKAVIEVTAPADGEVTTNPVPTITGTFANAASVQLYVNGVATGTPITSSPFNITLTQGLKEGRNSIAVSGYATGQEGNANFRSTSGVKVVTLDTTGPTVTITSPSSGTTVNTAGITIEGTVNDPTVQTVSINSDDVPVVDGVFSQDVELTAGVNVITVFGTDPLANVGPVAMTSVTFDNEAPKVTVTAPVNGEVTNTGSILVTGTIDDTAITTAQLQINGQSENIPVIDGAFSKTVTLTQNSNTIKVNATDGVNAGSSGDVIVKRDIVLPKLAISITDPTTTATVTVKSSEKLAAKPVVNGGALGAVTMTQVGENEWTGVITPVGGFTPGTNYTVTANGADLAGNAAVTANVKFQKTAVTATAGTPQNVNTDAANLQVTTDTDVAGETISVTAHTENLAENDSNASNAAGVFLEIVASGALSETIETIYVEVPYDPAEVFALGLDENTLKLYTWDVATGEWTAEEDSGVDTENKFVWANIHHLSKFGAFGTALTTEPAPPTVYVPPVYTVDLTDSGMTTDDTLRINSLGTVQSTATLTTADGMLSYRMTTNMIVKDAEGKALTEGFGAVVVADPPTSPEGTQIVSSYDMLPDGATFNPAIVLTMTYDPATIPEGMDESMLYIAWWNGSEWVALESSVDTVANVVTAEAAHFTEFALIGEVEEEEPVVDPETPEQTPAEFTVSSLSITPASVEVGDIVTIEVLVANTGEASGSYTVTLNINGSAVETRDVTLGGGASQTVTFTTTAETAGDYTVDVDGQAGSYTVTEPVVVEPDEPDEPEEPVEPVEPDGGMPAWAWILIIVAVLAILGGGYWWLRRRQMA